MNSSTDEPTTADLVVTVARMMMNPTAHEGQRVQLAIRGARDLPPREGDVTLVEDGQAYVTNLEDFIGVGVRPGNMFGQWVSSRAWNPDAEDEVYEVRVVAPSPES